MTVIPKDVVLEDDFHVLYGEKVEVLGKVKGDLIVLAGDVLIKGDVDGDLIAIGKNVEISGRVSQDARVISGTTLILGEIGRNIIAVGRSVYVGGGTKLSGGLLILSGSLSVKTPIEGLLQAYTGTTLISSSVQNAKIYSGELTLDEKAVVNGNLDYVGSKEAVVSENVKIVGKFQQRINDLMPNLSSSKQLASELATFKIRVVIIDFITSYVIGLIFINLLPGLALKIVDTLNKRFFGSVISGIFFALVTPVGVIFFAATIFAIPIALILLLALLITFYFSKIIVGFWVGGKILGKVKFGGNYFPLFLGLSIYYLITYNWTFGFPIFLLSAVLVLGGMLLTILDLYKIGRSAKII